MSAKTKPRIVVDDDAFDALFARAKSPSEPPKPDPELTRLSQRVASMANEVVATRQVSRAIADTLTQMANEIARIAAAKPARRPWEMVPEYDGEGNVTRVRINPID